MAPGVKKEYLALDNKPVLLHTLEIFVRTGLFSMIALTYPAGGRQQMTDVISALTFHGKMLLCEGGCTRQQSVLAGLELLMEHGPTYVLIHDGARPWVSQSVITSVVECIIEHGSGAPVVPAVNALKTIDDSGMIKEHLSRSSVVGVQTPQGFVFPGILKAHRKASRDGYNYIDDTEIYSRYCGPVYTVPGDPANRKITYAHDVMEAL